MTDSETKKEDYVKFIKVYQNYPRELAAIAAAEQTNLAVSAEAENYNAGTMQKDTDIGLSDNIVIADAVSFENAFTGYRQNQPKISDTEAKARVVFDYLQQHGAPFSYEQNKDDILWGNTTREQFYADAIYNNSQSNTNFFDRHIGNMQLLCLEPKGADDLPRNLDGLSPETLTAFKHIPPQERSEILLKRGLYHESIHMAMGTTDERKCDTFALLKVMKEHPDHAQTIFDIYNMQRSKMGYAIDTLHKSVHKKDSQPYDRAIKGGAMTYLMPNTYKKLEEYARHPEKIPDNDAELLKLACKLTAEVEFSKEQLNSFQKLIQKEHISPADLADNTIVQSCMAQGNFTNIDSYINSDKKLKNFLSKQDNQQQTASINKIAELRRTANTTSAAKQPPSTDHQKINQAFYQKMAEKQAGK